MGPDKIPFLERGNFTSSKMEQFHGIFALKTSLLHAVLDNCTHSQLTFDIKHWVEILTE